METNPWDQLAPQFSGDQPLESIAWGAIANTLIVNPLILDFVTNRRPAPARLLDFGCGGGRLARSAAELGYEAHGIDQSRELIASARRGSNQVSYHLGGAGDVASLGKFDAITAVMSIQFVEDIPATLSALTQALSDDGILVFAVHNPDRVNHGIPRGDYPPLTQTPNGPRTTLTFPGEVSVPLFVLTEHDYDSILAPLGFRRRLHTEPIVPQEFVERYKATPGLHSPYLILGYDRRLP